MMNKSILLILFAIPTLFIPCCSVKHTLHENILYKDDNFNQDHLRNNRCVILGISSGLANLTDQERMHYSILLSDILYHKKWNTSHSADLIHVNQLKNIIGETDLIRTMKAFDDTETHNQKIWKFVRDTIPNAKYLLTAFIKNETIKNDTPCEEYIKDDSGDEKLRTTYHKQYTLTVEFRIYNTHQGKLVWNSSITNEANRTEQVVEEPVNSVGELVFDILLGDSEDTDPARIDRRKVLVKTFEKLADQLLD